MSFFFRFGLNAKLICIQFVQKLHLYFICRNPGFVFLFDFLVEFSFFFQLDSSIQVGNPHSGNPNFSGLNPCGTHSGKRRVYLRVQQIKYSFGSGFGTAKPRPRPKFFHPFLYSLFNREADGVITQLHYLCSKSERQSSFSIQILHLLN